jgi:iron complex outermembrane recepter protein
MLIKSTTYLFFIGLLLQNTITQAKEAKQLDYLLGLSLEELLEVSILGQGETRQIQDILAEEIRYAIPGSNPLKVLQRLPGVHFQAADPWGNYEWSTKLSIRGFKERQLGFTLDDVPLGDMVYGNNNGLHVSRAIILENLEKIRIAQGSGALGTPSVINLGGTIQFISNDPSNVESIVVNQLWGSSNALRTFARADSGKIDKTKAYISFAKLEADKWKGYGLQVTQDQLNTKIIHDINEHNSISLFANISQRLEVDYVDYSLESFQRLGWNWDNYNPDWQRAVNVAKGILTGNVKTLDDAYFLGRGLRNDELLGISSLFKLQDNLNLKTTIYYHHNKGQGHWYTPYFPSSINIPISLRTTNYQINRFGIVSSLNWKFEEHEISTGLWMEKNQYGLSRDFYQLTSPVDTAFFLSNPDITQFKQHFKSFTQQFYIQDTFTQGDLKISLGAKSPKVKTTTQSEIGNRAEGSLETSQTFLPQIGLKYPLDKQNEFFVSYAKNARLFSEGLLGPFDATQDVFTQTKTRLKPELSTTVDIGWRLKQEKLQASLALYSTIFRDRLLWISQCSNILGCPNSLANVGKVNTKGLESTLLWMPLNHISWFSAFTYNNSEYQGNYLDGTTLVEATGKTVVDTPKILFSSDVTYENNGYFARVGGKYTGKRYLTYTNDLGLSGFTIWYLSVGYQYKNSIQLNKLRLQLNIDNLFDKKYFSSIGTNAFLSQDPMGLNYTLQQGTPRQIFFSLSFSL